MKEKKKQLKYLSQAVYGFDLGLETFYFIFYIYINVRGIA